MGNTATNVSTGKPKITGSIHRAPKGTTLPTNATSALDSAFICLGYVSEDGLENENGLSLNDIKAWGGNIVYRSLTEMTDNFIFKLIESLNVDVLKTTYGDDNVSVDISTGEVTVNVKTEDPQEASWVFELALRGGVKKRIVIQTGAVTARENIAYNDSDAIAYGVTVSAYPDEDGNTHKEYLSTASSVTTYTVTFDTDEGSEVDSQTVISGGKAVQPANPTKTDYTFAGWFAEETFETVFNFNTPITQNTTVYAKFVS